jgi:hypothetical protein
MEHASIIWRDIVGVKEESFLHCEGVSIWFCTCVDMGNAYVS